MIVSVKLMVTAQVFNIQMFSSYQSGLYAEATNSNGILFAFFKYT